MRCPSLRDAQNIMLYNVTDMIHRRTALVRAAFLLLIPPLGSLGVEALKRRLRRRKMALPLEFRSVIVLKLQTRMDGMAQQQDLDEERSRL
eukprot:8797734-Pyramimonas_sp.AAC.1